jgi:hypothetical protein
MAVLANTVYVVLLRDVTSLAGLAVAAHAHGTAADAVVPPARLVNRTSFIRDVVFRNPLESIVCVAAVTAIVLLLAGNKHLR